MYFILRDNIFLRKWKGENPIYFEKGMRARYALTDEKYDFLKKCDSNNDLEESDLSLSLEFTGLIKKCKKGEFNLSKNRIIEYENFHFPSISWNITEKCNLKCIHCYNATDNSPWTSEFSLDEAYKLMDEMVECGVKSVMVTGGEPTIHPHFREIIKGLYDRKIILRTLLTNGNFFDDDLALFVKEYYPEVIVQISFDGMGFHDSFRGVKGCGEKSLNAMKVVKKNGLYLRADTNVNKGNAHLILDTVKIFSEIGADTIRVLRTTETPRWALNQNNTSMDFKEYYDFSMDFAKQYKEAGDLTRVYLWQSIYLNAKKKEFSAITMKTSKEEYCDDYPSCPFIRELPCIRANGDMVPCVATTGILEERGICFANVKKEGLKKVFSDEKAMAFNLLTAGQKINGNEKCKTCDYAKVCHGGCPAFSVLYSGDVLKPDLSKCLFFEEGYYDKLCRVMDGWTNVNPL